MKLSVCCAFLLAMLGGQQHMAAATDPPRVVVDKFSTYSNLAWGFSNGGKDTATGNSVILVDLDDITTSQINQYKAQNHIVQCYFSVGTAEPWRPDHVPANWDPLALGTLPQFGDEYWLDLTRLESIKVLMQPRFNRAKALGCDAIEPDNTDCYDNPECKNPILNKQPGANVRQLQIIYCRWLAEAAHKLGMSISLKNSADIVPDLVDLYDFAVTEQCHQYQECNMYSPFVTRNKAVFNHEYALGSGTTYCTQANTLGIRTKRCAGSPSNGICNAASTWQNCFAALNPIPTRVFTQGGSTSSPVVTPSPTTKAPVATPSPSTKAPVVTPAPTTKAPVVTPSPTTKAPSTARPTKRPTKRRRRRGLDAV